MRLLFSRALAQQALELGTVEGSAAGEEAVTEEQSGDSGASEDGEELETWEESEIGSGSESREHAQAWEDSVVWDQWLEQNWGLAWHWPSDDPDVLHSMNTLGRGNREAPS